MSKEGPVIFQDVKAKGLLKHIIIGGVFMSTLADTIAISGQVRGYDRTPIHMIEVTVYRDTRFVTRAYTNEEGRYEVSVPAGEPITVRFDTHWSLTNAQEWHPSVVANIDAKNDIVLDRFLMRVGMGVSETAAIDALSAYQFCAMWTTGDAEPGYAEYAAMRVSRMKLITEAMRDIQQKLEEHFRKQAHSPSR
jgi:hypothetical protein